MGSGGMGIDLSPLVSTLSFIHSFRKDLSLCSRWCGSSEQNRSFGFWSHAGSGEAAIKLSKPNMHTFRGRSGRKAGHQGRGCDLQRKGQRNLPEKEVFEQL